MKENLSEQQQISDALLRGIAVGITEPSEITAKRMAQEILDARAASTPEAASRDRHNALLEALEAVKAERLQGHEHNLGNSLDVDAGAAAYSQAINDCEVAITELLSAPSSGEQDEPSPREREFCEAMTELNDDPAFIRRMMDLFINACNERVAKGGYLNEGDVN